MRSPHPYPIRVEERWRARRRSPAEYAALRVALALEGREVEVFYGGHRAVIRGTGIHWSSTRDEREKLEELCLEEYFWEEP